MADRKITDLTALAAGSQATGDLLTIVDVSEGAAADKNKKITVESLFKGIPGDVGIGTTAPSVKLEVSGTSNTASRAIFARTDVSRSAIIGGNRDTSNCPFVGTPDNVAFAFITNNNERARIDSSGNLGVGTTSPDQMLHLSNNSGPVLRFENTDTTIASGNSFGAIEFESRDSSSSAGVVAKIEGFAPNTMDGTATNGGAIRFSTATVNPVSLSERVRIDSSGDIDLSIAAANNATRTVSLRSDYGGGTFFDNAALALVQDNSGSSGGHLEFLTTTSGGASPTERMRINSSGNLLVGTTSDSIYNDTSGGGFNIKGDGQLVLAKEATSSADPLVWLNDTGQTTNKSIVFAQDGSEKANIGLAGNDATVTVNGSERMRIDTQGRLLVGTTSSSEPSRAVFQANSGSTTSYGAIKLARGNAPSNGFRIGSLQFTDNNHEPAAAVEAERDGGTWTSGSSHPTRITFLTTADSSSSTTERMRVRADGKILMNCTATDDTGILQLRNTVGTSHCLGLGTSSSNADTLVVMRHGTAANGSGGTTVGTITCNSTSTTYGTSSDYRLKENVVNLAGAIDRVKQLAPKRFNFIVDPNKVVDGFLAHEAQAVVPEAVYGTHNEVDDDGNAVMQVIDQSKLVPLLTAALQEAIAEIETLKTKVAALDAG